MQSGTANYQRDGRDEENRPVANGLYLLTIAVDDTELAASLVTIFQ